MYLLGLVICTSVAFAAVKDATVRLCGSVIDSASPSIVLTPGRVMLLHAVAWASSPDEKRRFVAGRAFEALVRAVEHELLPQLVAIACSLNSRCMQFK